MALETKVPAEIRAWEAKVIGPMSWRQLAATAAAAPLTALTVWQLWGSPVLAYVCFAVWTPFFMWGWWRPKALKPERFWPYIRHRYNGRKVLTYEPGDAQREEDRRRQHEPQRIDVAVLEGRRSTARALGPSRPEPARAGRLPRRKAQEERS